MTDRRLSPFALAARQNLEEHVAIVRVVYWDVDGDERTYGINIDSIEKASAVLWEKIDYSAYEYPVLTLDGIDNYDMKNECEICEVLLYFIVNQTLPIATITSEQENQDTQALMIGVWIFGWAYEMPELQNAAMLELLPLGSQHATPKYALEQIQQVLGHQPEWAPLEQFQMEQSALALLKFKTAKFTEPWPDQREGELRESLEELVCDIGAFDHRTNEQKKAKYMVEE